MAAFESVLGTACTVPRELCTVQTLFLTSYFYICLRCVGCRVVCWQEYMVLYTSLKCILYRINKEFTDTTHITHISLFIHFLRFTFIFLQCWWLVLHSCSMTDLYTCKSVPVLLFIQITQAYIWTKTTDSVVGDKTAPKSSVDLLWF